MRYVLEGSVRRADDRLRFTGQLIDATTGRHIWADRFDGEMSDVFDLQDRFTESVVAAIEPSLQLAEIERVKSKAPDNLDAYDLLLRAQQLEYDYTEESLSAALPCLKQALAIDPRYAPALALAAYCHAVRNIQGWAADPKSAATEGFRLHRWRTILGGMTRMSCGWRLRDPAFCAGYPSREGIGYRSVLLNPNSAIALTIAGWLEAVTGHPDKALDLLGRAQRLSPRDPRAWFMLGAVGLAHLAAERFEEATVACRAALDQNPRHAQSLRVLGASLAMLGQHERAAEVVQDILAIEPQFTLTMLRARLRGMADDVWSKLAQGLRRAGLPE